MESDIANLRASTLWILEKYSSAGPVDEVDWDEDEQSVFVVGYEDNRSDESPCDLSDIGSQSGLGDVIDVSQVDAAYIAEFNEQVEAAFFNYKNAKREWRQFRPKGHNFFVTDATRISVVKAAGKEVERSKTQKLSQ